MECQSNNILTSDSDTNQYKIVDRSIYRRIERVNKLAFI